MFKLNTYKVYFNYRNGNTDLQFSLRCVNDYVAELRINRILKNAYLLKCYLDNVDNILIYENGVEILICRYVDYLNKYGIFNL